MNSGFLGTRADLLMDIILVAVIAVPFIFYTSIRFSRKARYEVHRWLQFTTFAVVILAVVIFELKIRLYGGYSPLVPSSSWAAQTWFKSLLWVHIGVALGTFGAWGVLLCRTWKRDRQDLPGTFSSTHKTWGWSIFGGSCLTALTGGLVYIGHFVT